METLLTATAMTYMLEHYVIRNKIPDNYEKIVVSLDDVQLPSRFGILHLRAWELNDIL